MPFDSTSRRSFLKAGVGAVAATSLQDVVLAHENDNGDRTPVTIRRDGYGVPHVYSSEADSPEPTFYGFGYALAEDRLFQIEMYRRFYHGTVSAVLGKEWVEFDKAARRNRSGSIPLSEQFETQLESEHRAVLQAFADGINRYITNVETSEQKFHKGFHKYDFRPDSWDMVDVAGVFVASMAYFSDYTLETLDAAVLDQLESRYSAEKAMAIFSDLNWGDDPSAPTSTKQPEVGYTPPYTPAGDTDENEECTDKDEEESMDAATDDPLMDDHSGGERRIPSDPVAVHEAELDRQQTLAAGLDTLNLPIKLGSNALAVSADITESGDALLFGGPQMGFSTPSVMHEVGLHGPDFDVTGSTVAGYPFVMFGHNKHGAMTSTAGLDNSIQTFVETIRTNGESAEYKFRGEWYDVDRHTETIPVADAPDASVAIRRTRHGVITQWNPENGEAISHSRSYEDLDMTSWRAFYDAQFATDAGEFVDAAQQCNYSLNFMWAGEEGDIAYAHLGRYPNWKEVPWDTRFPADGTKHELTDKDYLSASEGEVPSAINPSSGYSAQWNNKPAPNWNNGDMSYAWGTDHRVQRIINLIEHRLKMEETVSYDFLKDIVYDIAFVDLRAIRYKDALLAAYEDEHPTGVEAEALTTVREWDNFRQGSGEDYTGKYPVGYTVFDQFFPKLLRETFFDVFGSADAYQRALALLNYRYGRPALMRALHPEEAALSPAIDYFGGERDTVFRCAFQEAVAELRKTYGDDVSSWRKPARIDDLDNLSLFGVPIGISDAGDMPWMNRGTENHFVRATGDGFKAENILPPGNSGYVFPNGAHSKHYADQLKEFIDFEYKTLLFTKSQVTQNQESLKQLQSEESDPQDSDDTHSKVNETNSPDETDNEYDSDEENFYDPPADDPLNARFRDCCANTVSSPPDNGVLNLNIVYGMFNGEPYDVEITAPGLTESQIESIIFDSARYDTENLNRTAIVGMDFTSVPANEYVFTVNVVGENAKTTVPLTIPNESRTEQQAGQAD